jgi:integrase
LETKNVFLDENKIIGGMKTDNGVDRVVPIHPEIKHLVEKRYIQATERYHSDRLFNDPKGQQNTKMTYDMYRGRFTNVMNEMGFKGLTPHCTRHTFSTQAKRCGMDSGIRKRIMGHSLNGDITESVYTHPTFNDLVHEMNKLDFTVTEYV